MINYHGIPPSPVCPPRPANALRKSYASVGHEHLTPCQWATRKQHAWLGAYNPIVLDVISLTPSAHYPGIVHSNHDYNIYAFAFDLVQMFNVTRKVAN